MNDYERTLYHSGVKGMHWGQWNEETRRRYNGSGPRTTGNKQREMSSGTKKALKVAGGLAVAAGVGAAAYYSPAFRAALVKGAKAGGKVALETGKKVSNTLVEKQVGQKVLKAVGDSANRVGKAMTDAAIASVGGIAVTKIAEKYADKETDSEATKNVNKIKRDTFTAGVQTLTKANGGNNSNNNSKTGDANIPGVQPSKKTIDKSSSEYQNLFKDSNGNPRTSEDRILIKQLANKGYDTDQIDKYLKNR